MDVQSYLYMVCEICLSVQNQDKDVFVTVYHT